MIHTLHWRHNGRDCVSNHQPYDCLLNHLFRCKSKKTSKLRGTGLCEGNSPGTGDSPHKWLVTRKMFPFDDVIMYKKCEHQPTNIRYLCYNSLILTLLFLRHFLKFHHCFCRRFVILRHLDCHLMQHFHGLGMVISEKFCSSLNAHLWRYASQHNTLYWTIYIKKNGDGHFLNASMWCLHVFVSVVVALL